MRLSCQWLTLTFLRRQASQAAKTAARRGGRGDEVANDEEGSNAGGGFADVDDERGAGRIGMWFCGMALGCEGSKQSTRSGRQFGRS